jgi:hypothetical protein
MAQLQLRDCTIRFRDGTAGTATVNANGTANDTNVSFTANTVNMTRAIDSELVPIGARFTVNTNNNTTVYIVTGRTITNNTNIVTSINFSPAWGANAPLANDVITFLPQQLDIHIGEGNLTYTEHRDYKYTLDRSLLDEVKFGDEKPVDVKTDFLYEFVTTGTSEEVTPVDALKQINGAKEWVSADSDLCRPYAVDVEVFHKQPCGTAEHEVTSLPAFRYETLEFNFKDATIAVTGKCNVVEATVSRTSTVEDRLSPSA